MANLSEREEQLARESKWDFSDLHPLFINCTLKRSPEVSNTRGLADLAVAIMERNVLGLHPTAIRRACGMPDVASTSLTPTTAERDRDGSGLRDQLVMSTAATNAR